ncbi:hypothetical protein C7374_11842 [Falsochrobactrum ovis]|uniref:Uncharacterized protein n=1 Tax=Falsochrobactrum ovis TaxID=1293442 RepID=A0A364JSN2_9HYPH|nr:hypothetical protein C7374_11842 [Falsochrobactrum ovis]
MTIGYEDLNSPFIAGQYSYKDKLIDVGQSQILDWETDSTIRFRPCGRIDSGIGLRIPRRNPV